MEINIKTNFNLYDIAYVLYKNKVISCKINKIRINTVIHKEPINFIYYGLLANDYTLGYIGEYEEKDLYKTKEELINSL